MSFKKGEIVYDLVYNRIVVILDYYGIYPNLECFKVCAPIIVSTGSYSVRNIHELRKLTKLEKVLA